MNITPTVTNWTADNKQFSLVFDENPLTDFVELPDDGKAQDELWYSNILCGVIRGALEMVGHQSSSLFIDSNVPPGPNAGGSSLCYGCLTRQRYDRDAHHTVEVH